jgi:Tfp pilus assembly protein PilX
MISGRNQRGIVLIFVMLFLVLITLLSISAFRASTTNLRATRNMMIRQEAQSAAQWAIEDTISNGNFETAAPAPFTKDATGDGTNNYTVTMTVPTCKKIRYLMVKELPKNPATGIPNEEWRTCDSGRTGQAQGSGPGLIEMAPAASAPATSTVKSYCAEALWDIQANVVDSRTNTQVEVHQGIAVPHPIDKIDAVCNRS